MSDANLDPRFDIAAAVVFRLGEELITDVVQALAELVKNSYDADATWVRVTIATPKTDAAHGSLEAKGAIVIEDDGHGMNESAIRNGWLMIADSSKKTMKDEGRKTLRNRTPVGDKGLGRLGVQRLGYEVDIVSSTADSQSEVRLSFSWRDFQNASRLSEVPVSLANHPNTRSRAGTRIVVRDLKDPHQWVGDEARRRLQRKLSELISPFKEVRDFLISVAIDGEDISIVEIADRLRETAAVRYKIRFDQTQLHVSGNVKLDFVARAQKKEDEELLKLLLRKDEGEAFFEYLKAEEKNRRPPNLTFHTNSRWFVSFEYSLKLSDLGGVELVDGIPANPGGFHGEVDYLLLDSSDLDPHVWDRANEYRRLVGEIAGIRVYRDGFGIRVGEDWLGLGKHQTSGGSLYGLRPKNVIGFIALSADDNRALLETTSREGFQATPHYSNFYRLLSKFVTWSSDAQEYLRRGAVNFLKYSRAKDAGLDYQGKISTAAGALREHAVAIDKRDAKLRSARDSIKKIASEAQTKAKLFAADKQLSLYHQDKVTNLTDLTSELSASIGKIEETLEEFQPESTSIARAQQILQVLIERDERLRQELDSFYEGIALGLTAESLSHEIAGVAERLSAKSAAFARYLEQNSVRDSKIRAYVETVKSSIGSLRKQLSHLDPSLRYVRESREWILLSKELEDTRDFYSERFKERGITMTVITAHDFSIYGNRGKFSQIFDNIILNSEYWLREEIRRSPNFHGEISITIESPLLIVEDNGPGISLSVEDTLFDPFVTTKGLGAGRGLGLFIVRQLLDSSGCTIDLLPERNLSGRRYRLIIDMKGAINE